MILILSHQQSQLQRSENGGEMGLGEGSLLLSSGLPDQAAQIFDQKTKYNTRKSLLHHNQLKPLVIEQTDIMVCSQ